MQNEDTNLGTRVETSGQESKSCAQSPALPINGSFSKKNPLLQVIWDSTSLGTLKECPRKYFLSIIQGWQPKTNAVALDFGILLHECLEKFYRREAEGCGREENIRETIGDALRSPLRDKIAEANDQVRNVKTLCVALIDYLDFYNGEPEKTVVLKDGTVGVELHFQFETGLRATSGEVFSMSGNIDRLVETPTGVFILDHKTTSMPLSQYYFKQYDLDNQMTCYAVAGDVVFGTPCRGVLIDGIKLKGSIEFSRYMTLRSKEACDEWLADLEHWFRVAEYYSQIGEYPANDKSCNKYSGCPFAEICKAPRGLRRQMLEDNFTQRVWDASKPREAGRDG